VGVTARVLLCAFAGIAIVALASCGPAKPDAMATLKKVFADRPTVADADNAFLDVHGFAAPEGVDPHELGARRVAWLEKFRVDPETAGDDPGKPALDVKGSRSQALRQVIAACRAAVARACGSALERVKGNLPLSDIEPVLLARYEVLLARRGWYEIGTAVPRAPLPSYEGTMEAQRLLLIRLGDAAAAGDVEKVRTTLSQDLAFWRRMLGSSDVLISKMMGLAGIRQHFSLGSHLLRVLPADRVMDAIPAQWHEEFSADELSMRRPMAGEIVLSEALYKEAEAGLYGLDWMNEPGDELQDPVDRLMNRVSDVRSSGLTLGQIADYYLSAAEAFQAPLSEYEAAAAKLAKRYPSSKMGSDIGQYALRIGSAEGMRRAALLTARLRSHSVSVTELENRLGESPLRNPYNGQPFVWEAADQAIVYTGPEHRKFARQAYLY
jgi:hypothetical protein